MPLLSPQIQFYILPTLSVELFELTQLLCEFQDYYSPHKNDCGVVDIFFHITLKLDAGLKNESVTKVPIHYRDQLEQILDDLEHIGIIE